MKLTSETEKLLVPFLESYYRLPEEQRGSIEQFESILIHLESDLAQHSDDLSSLKTILAQLWLQVGNLDKSLAALDSLRNHLSNTISPNQGIKQSFVSHWNTLHWNLSILFLKSGRLKEGWSLFDFGLRVKADGPQRWQRSLKKPFASSSIPLWRGESLLNKKILLLGEQGIGDSMMFATLIPRLVDNGAQVFFYPGERLNAIYKDSNINLTVVSAVDLKTHKYTPNDFDYQSPIASICQHGFDVISKYSPITPVLRANTARTDLLRSKYYKGKPLVGISWQGGGRPKRIKKKSCELVDLMPIFSRTDVDFVSLQYGNDGPILEKFNKKHNLSIIHDDDVDPIKDMYGWLSQVKAMDFVISIANTTVHGSGGLGIPTMCLVSTDSDWRWINPEIYKGNYWYSKVDTAYQSEDGGWYDAVKETNEWLSSQILSK